jgi:hypothetical protein
MLQRGRKSPETGRRRRPYDSADSTTFDTRETRMLRTIFSIGLFAVLGLVALKFIFGIFGFAVGLFMWLLFAALKVAIVGLCIYLVIRIFSPETARRLRQRWSGSSM